MNRFVLFSLAVSLFLLVDCSGNGDSFPAYTIGGTVSGLTGEGLVLQNNGGDDLAVAGVSFEFATALRDGSTYKVTVLIQPTGQYCDVSNGSGTVRGADVTDVTLTCRGWGTPELIQSDPGFAIRPDIAIDVAGNALAVWAQEAEGTYLSIWSNRYTAGSGWGTAELFESEIALSTTGPKIAIDAAGNALAVWEQWTLRYNIYSNRYTFGSGWGLPEPVESDDAGSAYVPQIAFDAAGNALAVWIQNIFDIFDPGPFNVWSNRYTPGSGWGTPELIENVDTGDAAHPQIAVDAAGNALAVWEQESEYGRRDIYSNRYTAGSGWGTPELIENVDTGDATDPQIAVDAAGNALAVWRHKVGYRSIIYSNRYAAGSGWGTPEAIDDSTGTSRSPQIAMDGAGNALAVWVHGNLVDIPFDPRIEQKKIWSNRYTFGSGWGTAEQIGSDNAGDVEPDAESPQIAFDATGNAMSVWSQSDGIRDNIWSSRYHASSGWGTPELIAAGASRPQLAINGGGNAVAVWSFGGIWSSRYE